MIASEVIPLDEDVCDLQSTDPIVLDFRKVLPRVDFVWIHSTRDPNRPGVVQNTRYTTSDIA
jgi:hypothetical protein